jgi:hypothetical protein
VLGVAATLASARADELDRVFRAVLNDPTSSALNLRYARLALARGQNRKALAAYERVLETDPFNAEARAGLHTLKLALEPVVTRLRVELGGEYETNPRELPRSVSRPNDTHGLARFSLYDQRAMLGHIWRTRARGLAEIYDDLSDLDFWRAGVFTGPVFDLGDGVELHVAPGGSLAWLDHEFFYAEPGLWLTVGNLWPGVVERIDIRGGYRDVSNNFFNGNGYVADVIVTHKSRGVLIAGDAFYLYPRFRYREPSGSSTSGFGGPSGFFPGDFIEFGGRAYYLVPIAPHVIFGLQVFAHYRKYKQDIRFGTKRRRDWFVAPGVQILLPNILSERSKNHVAGVRAIRRF